MALCGFQEWAEWRFFPCAAEKIKGALQVAGMRLSLLGNAVEL